MIKLVNIIFLFYLLLGMLFTSCSSKTKKIFGDQILELNDTIYISGIIDLKRRTIEIKRKFLHFDSGALIKNGMIIGNEISIIAPAKKIFNNLKIAGNWNTKAARLEWFLGNDFSDPIQNFYYLSLFVSVDAAIQIDKMIPIAAKHSRDFFSDGRNINISGKDKNVSGLILQTKHENGFYSYFRSANGFNLSLENLSIISNDFTQGKTTDKASEYLFTGSYYQSQFNPTSKPNIDSIFIRNCNISGNISIASYGSHSDNQTIQEFATQNKVSKILIEKCEFDNVNSAFGFSNMAYDSILIRNNKIKNFSETFISVPESGLNQSHFESVRKNKKYVEFSDNIFENQHAVYTPDGRTLSPCVIKGGYGDMLFVRNILKNLISYNENSDVNTMYYTCDHPGKCIFSDNQLTDVIGRGGRKYAASIIKDRGAENIIIENNNIRINKEALVKNGVIRSVSEDLSKLDGNKFLCTFIQVGNQSDLTKTMIVRNNRIQVPFINMSTEIYNVAQFRFENNDVEIENFVPSGLEISVSKDNSFFLGRQRLDRNPKAKPYDFLCNFNKIRIGNVPAKIFNYIYFPDGVQAGRLGFPDLNPNYNNVLINDSIFVNNTTTGISMLDGISQDYNISVSGKNNSFTFYDGTGSNHLRPNAQQFKSDIRIASTSAAMNDESPFVLIPKSKQIFQASHHDGSDINLLSYTYFTSLYNLANEENMICIYNIKWIDKSSENAEMMYFFHLNNKERSFSVEVENGDFLTVNPNHFRKHAESVRVDIKKRMNTEKLPVPKLFYGDRHLKNAVLKLTNCQDIKSYIIELNIIPSVKTRPKIDEVKKSVQEFMSRKDN